MYEYFTVKGYQYRTDGQTVEANDPSGWHTTGSLPIVLEAIKLWKSKHAPQGCYCQPGKCMAPVIMGHQTPCRDPQKAAHQATVLP